MSRYWTGVYWLIAEYGLPTDVAREVWTAVRDVVGFSPDYRDLEDFRDIVAAVLDDMYGPEEPPPPDEPEEWEVSLRYPGEKHVEDITVRMVARSLQAHTRDQVRGAFWRAVQRGPESLNEWDVYVMDWRNYEYPSEQTSLTEAFENARGIFITVGMDGLRVDPVS